MKARLDSRSFFRPEARSLGRRRLSRSGLSGLFILLPVLSGCIPFTGRGEPLTIATPWTEPERKAIEAEFGQWRAKAEGRTRPTSSARIEWIPLAPDDLARATRQKGSALFLRAKVDIVLGGPASSYARMAQEGLLQSFSRPDNPAWRIARRSPIGKAVAAGSTVSPTGAASKGPAPLTFDDPRHDPIALAWAKGRLHQKSWAEGYAELVREAGGPRRIGRQPGSALAAVERGEATATPAPAASVEGRAKALSFVSVVDPPEWAEGVAILQSGPRKDMSEAFLRFLADRGQAEIPSAQESEEAEADADADALLADLLGATLVDAQDELWEAWSALGPPGHRVRLEMWMTEPPPWPPASIAKLMDRDGSGDLVRTLADELAPDADVRNWLLRGWLGPTRLIDGAWLEEASKAAEGRLLREPRFRAWLRAEWTAWARQRYRRVARQAKGLAS